MEASIEAECVKPNERCCSFLGSVRSIPHSLTHSLTYPHTMFCSGSKTERKKGSLGWRRKSLHVDKRLGWPQKRGTEGRIHVRTLGRTSSTLHAYIHTDCGRSEGLANDSNIPAVSILCYGRKDGRKDTRRADAHKRKWRCCFHTYQMKNSISYNDKLLIIFAAPYCMYSMLMVCAGSLVRPTTLTFHFIFMAAGMRSIKPDLLRLQEAGLIVFGSE